MRCLLPPWLALRGCDTKWRSACLPSAPLLSLFFSSHGDARGTRGHTQRHCTTAGTGTWYVYVEYAISGRSRILAPLDHRCCNVCPLSSVYGHPYCPHGSSGPIRLCSSCGKSSRAYNSDVGYDSQIVSSGGGVTRQIVEEGVGQTMRRARRMQSRSCLGHANPASSKPPTQMQGTHSGVAFRRRRRRRRRARPASCMWVVALQLRGE